MKIAQVVCAFPPYRGGMGNVAHHYSLELANLGHEVTVFTPHYKDREAQMENFKIKSLVPWLSYGLGAWLPQLFWQLRGFDIVHLHYPFFGGALPVYCLKRYLPKETKLVLTYHLDVVGRGLLGKYFSWHTKHLMPRMIKIADKIIVTSRDYAENSNLAPFIKSMPEKFVEIPLGTDANIFHPLARDQELMAKYQIKPEEKIILFVAALDRMHYFKGLNLLLEAMTKIKSQARLIVVGKGDMKEGYEAKAKELGIGNKVNFAGYVGGNDLPKYYNLADVFVMPSVDKSEAFGIVYTEAMACQKPVIAANLPGVRTVVEDNKTGYLITPGDLDGLVSRIEKILGDKELASKFGQAGLAKVRSEYTWAGIAKKIEEVYTNLS